MGIPRFFRYISSVLPPVYPNDEEIIEAKWVNVKDVGNYQLNSVTSKIIYEIIEKNSWLDFSTQKHIHYHKLLPLKYCILLKKSVKVI